MKPKPSAILNAASDPAAPAGGQAGGSPATAPVAAAPAAVAPPAAAAAATPPANSAPSAPPAPPAATTPPQNAAPAPVTLEAIQGAIGTAVTNAVKPLQDRLEAIEGQRAAGITPQNLAGAPAAAPVAGTGPAAPEGGTQKVTNLGLVSSAWKPAARQAQA